MKIGILTHPLGHNYGGILQNWALQQVIKKLGHEPVTIDWRNRNVEWISFFRASLSCSVRRCFGQKIDFPHSPYWKNPKFAGIRRFVEKNINITRPLFKNQIIPYIKKHFPIMIVGSDQVWRPLYINPIEMMFLPYRKNPGMKKIAYAASFGTEENEFSIEQAAKCKDLLKDFDAVSVREKSGINQCKAYFNCQRAMVTLDPTLLVDKDEYLNLCKDSIPDKSGYVFAYILDHNEELVQKGKELADKLGTSFKLLSADSNIQPSDTIENWLLSFRDASYIITDSFHGTAFSIIFQKPFATVYNAERGSARIDNLISLFPGIRDRVIGPYQELPSINMDFSDIAIERNKLKQSSIDFLKTAIGD